MTRGDVALVWFPFSRAEEQPYKKRPVLVLNALGDGADEAVVCVMVTGNEARWRNPGRSDVPLADWRSYGLAKESIVRTRRIWTGQSRDFERVLGTVDDRTLASVCSLVVDLVRPPSLSPVPVGG